MTITWYLVMDILTKENFPIEEKRRKVIKEKIKVYKMKNKEYQRAFQNKNVEKMQQETIHLNMEVK